MYVYMYVCMYIYIYTYRERERGETRVRAISASDFQSMLRLSRNLWPWHCVEREALQV